MRVPPIWPSFRPTDERQRSNVKRNLNVTLPRTKKELRVLEVPTDFVSLYGKSGTLITTQSLRSKIDELV